MARGFGSTDGVGDDAITTTYSGSNTLQSWSLWAYRTGAGGGNLGRLFQKFDNTPGAALFYEAVTAANVYKFQVDWTTNPEWTIVPPSNNTWHHYLITYDAGSTTNDPIIYVDGVSVTVTRAIAPTGTFQVNTDPYYIGNSIVAGGRGWNG